MQSCCLKSSCRQNSPDLPGFLCAWNMAAHILIQLSLSRFHTFNTLAALSGLARNRMQLHCLLRRFLKTCSRYLKHSTNFSIQWNNINTNKLHRQSNPWKFHTNSCSRGISMRALFAIKSAWYHLGVAPAASHLFLNHVWSHSKFLSAFFPLAWHTPASHSFSWQSCWENHWVQLAPGDCLNYICIACCLQAFTVTGSGFECSTFGVCAAATQRHRMQMQE